MDETSIVASPGSQLGELLMAGNSGTGDLAEGTVDGGKIDGNGTVATDRTET